MRTCPVCGQENPEIARFCLACGAALVPEEERREERKVVTVLFADLVGFTSRAEKLDPEDVRAVLQPYWEHLRAELERFGGTVEKFIGDAVMALFGAPVAHEDDPERAVRAALAIRDWVRESGEDLQVRIAVNTGEALVLLGARPAEGEGMAAGDVVNTAARLQSAAPVNGILAGETTYRATREVVEYAEHEPVTAKGKAEPVPVWEALQARSRLGMDLEQRTLLPLVGRVRELETIIGAFERARREREPQLVTLVGVPGIGKSRLVAELFARIEADPEIVGWRQGRALPYGAGVSFWALAEMVKAQAGIEENDAPAEVEAKLRASVEAAVEAGDRGWVAQHLLPLVGIERLQDSADRRDERFAAWRLYLEGLADQRPLVLVFEDLHWADDGLLDFVDHLAEWASGVPLLLLGTARPELLDRRPGWGGGKLNAVTLALTPLADEEAARIIGAVLEQALLPAETQRALLERAGGNPLYAEQFARLYLERGSTEGLPLPETVQGIIAARLDGLAAHEKPLLQDAAVVGKVFWAGAVAELGGLDRAAVVDALHALERKGLVRHERRSAVGGEDEYAFRHVLVRDVAYGQIPRGARAERHERAAAWIEGLGRADDHAELVAYHYASAVELARAAGGEADEQLVARTRSALRRAGERALRLNAYSSAQRLFAQALGLAPDERERPYLLFGHVTARFRGEGAPPEVFDEAVEALRGIGDVETAAEAAVLAVQGAWHGGRQSEAHERLVAARALLEGAPPSPALASLLAEAARVDVFAGREEGVAEGREALRLAEELALDRVQASALNTLAVERMFAGDHAGSGALIEQVLSLDPAAVAAERARALTNYTVLAWIEGDREAVDERHAAASEFAERIGDRRMLRWLAETPVIDAYADGRWDEMLVRIAAFLEEVAPQGGHYHEGMFLLHRALVLAARGDDAGALRDVERGLARAGSDTDAQSAVPTLVLGATTYLTLGDERRARELLDAATERWSAEAIGAAGAGGETLSVVVRLGRTAQWLEHYEDVVETRRTRAARLLLTGRTVEAADAYATIAASEEAAARLLAAEQLAAEGRRSEAAVQLERALAFYRAVGATRIVRRAEALLAEPAAS